MIRSATGADSGISASPRAVLRNVIVCAIARRSSSLSRKQ